jgi:anti-sigma factor RsiW
VSQDELACQELVEIITDYLEGTLPPEARARFEAHLQDCGPCVLYLEQLRQTIRAVGRVSAEAISEPTRQGLLLAFRDWKRANLAL